LTKVDYGSECVKFLNNPSGDVKSMSNINICDNLERDAVCFRRSVLDFCRSARMGRQVANAVCAVLYWHHVGGETKENHDKTVGKKTGLNSVRAELNTINANVLRSFRGC